MRIRPFASLLLPLRALGPGPVARAADPGEPPGRPIRLDDARLDRITAAHDWVMVLDPSRTPPAMAKVLVVHGGSPLVPPHGGLLVVEGPSPPLCNPTPCSFNASGPLDPLHWLDP